MILNKEQLIKVQTKLKELGLYTVKIDGISGTKTLAAIRAFQRVNNLSATGVITQTFLDKLFDVGIPNRPEVTQPTLPLNVGPNWPEWPIESDAALIRYYGQPNTNQTTMTFPYPMKLCWNLKQTVTRTSCHIKCKDAFYYIFEETKKQYSMEEIVKHGLNLFGGCLNPRKIRGGTRWSVHAFGAAIDLDTKRNELNWGRDKAYLAKPELDKFWRIVESTGCVSLGRSANYDWMHFQAARR